MQLKSATVTPSCSNSTQVGVTSNTVVRLQAEIVVANNNNKDKVGVVVNLVVLITVQMEEVAELVIGEAKETFPNSFTHQLHPPGQAGVGTGGTETTTGNTLTRDSMVGTDIDTSVKQRDQK